MTKTILAKVDNQFEQYSNEDCLKTFGMELPTEIHIVFSDSLIAKMKRIQQLAREERLTSVKTLSSYRAHPDSSYAELYRDGKKLEMHYYEDFDREFPVVDDLNCFGIECKSINGYDFTASFIYVNAACADMVVETVPFSID